MNPAPLAPLGAGGMLDCGPVDGGGALSLRMSVLRMGRTPPLEATTRVGAPYSLPNPSAFTAPRPTGPVAPRVGAAS